MSRLEEEAAQIGSLRFVDAELRGLGEGDEGASMWEGASKILEQVLGYARDAVKIYQDLDRDKSDSTVLALKDTADKATAALERSASSASAAVAAAANAASAPSSSPAAASGGRDSNLLLLGGLAVGAWWLWSKKKRRRRR